MVSLLPSGKENKLVLNFIDEAMRLFGIDCKLYDVSSMNMYLDDRILSECKFYKLLLQDYVDTRLLSNLKWSTVDFNKESIMALMPLQYNNQKFCLREFNVIELKDGTKYQIREVNSTYLVGVWYVVKLIAYTERIKQYFKNTHFIMRQSLPIQEIRDRKLLNGEDVEFPIILVRRTNCPIFSKEYNSISRAQTGQSYNTSPISNNNRNLMTIDKELADKVMSSGHHDCISLVNSTFELTYYIDVISFERDNFDTLVVELQENLFRAPYIWFFNKKSDGTIDKLVDKQASHLLVDDIEDTSDLENFDSGNAMYRMTITAKTNAYIYRKYRSLSVENINIEYKSPSGVTLNNISDNNTTTVDEI